MNNCSILISSHSNAFDIWKISHYFLTKYWQDCPFEIYLGANGDDNKSYCPPNWRYINTGPDISWSSSMLSYLNNIQTKYILLFLDDFVVLDHINTTTIKEAVLFANESGAKMLRLSPNPKGDIRVNDEFTRINIEGKVPYATSLQIALWDKKLLMDLLTYDFTPWEFETKAGKTPHCLKYHDLFFVSNSNLIQYTHIVEKGKFYPYILELVANEKVNFDLSNRPMMQPHELQSIKQSFVNKVLYTLIPNRYINNLRNLLGKAKL